MFPSDINILKMSRIYEYAKIQIRLELHGLEYRRTGRYKGTAINREVKQLHFRVLVKSRHFKRSAEKNFQTTVGFQKLYK